MKRIKQLAQFSLLVLGAVVTVATSQPDPPPYSSDEWVVENLYDGQTAVETDIEIRLTLGVWDFDVYDGENKGRAQRALESVRIYRADDESSTVDFTLEINSYDSVLRPVGLKDDTDYELDLSAVEDSIESGRVIPSPIRFRTGSLPRVVSLWRNEDTLLIAFSEPMNTDTLFLGHDSVDIFWQDDDALKSVVGDLNLADFVTQVDERLFMVAPVDFLGDAWVKVSGLVEGTSGISLDGDGDGEADGAGDDFLEEVYMLSLPECFTREDIPDPCVAEEDIPEEQFWM